MYSTNDEIFGRAWTIFFGDGQTRAELGHPDFELGAGGPHTLLPAWIKLGTSYTTGDYGDFTPKSYFRFVNTDLFNEM